MKRTVALGILLVSCAAALLADAPKAGPPEAKPLVNSIGMQLRQIPAGEFLMGSADSDPGATDDEKPQHRVRITKPFYIGVYEVTQGEYERVMGERRSFFSPTGPGKEKVAGMNADRFPAEQVRWTDAVEFCRRLSELPSERAERRVYRLPAEAEWEYACRAGTNTAFAFGDCLSSLQANFNGNFPFGDAPKGPFRARTTEVGSFEPNPFGMYDMHGNVWEWCSDWFDRSYYKHAPVEDPRGPETGTSRVIRGGEWYGDARDCRSSFRYADVPKGTFYVLGFRVVMTLADRAPSTKPAPVATKTKATPTKTRRRPVRPLGKEALAAGQGEDWPGWRGPRRDGTWHGPKLPETWPEEGLAPAWSQAIGGGHSGIAVVDGRVYTMDYHKEPEEVERVVCFAAATGELLWALPYSVDYTNVAYGNGPRATPAVHDGRVYTLGAVGHLYCLDAVTGEPIWSRDLVPDFGARIPIWGLSASPVLFEDLVIVHPGAEPDGCLIAFDLGSGEEVWRSVPDEAGYATPILIQNQSKPLLVSWTPSNVRCVDARTGALQWTIPFVVTYSTSIATPIFHDNVVLVSGYYEGAKAIQLTEGSTEASILWEDRRNLRGEMCQPLYRDGYGYLLDKRQGLTCFELKTGKRIWDAANRMTPKGRNPQATMVWLGDEDRVIVLNSDGELILARFNPAGYHEQSRTKIIDLTWAHPAYAAGRVFARNDTEIVCVPLTLAADGE